MSRTITAMFDSRSEAESASARLSASNIDADRVRIIDQNSQGGGSGGSAVGGNSDYTGTGGTSSGQGEGFWGSLKDLFMPEDDRHAYGEGIRRGHFMLVAEVDEQDADDACRILDQESSVDFDQRQDEWRTQGWANQQTDRQSGAFGATGTSSGQTTGLASGLGTGVTGDRTQGSKVDEEHIPIVEEQLRVGKREVERGGARVRSYVRETPVHEQVSLREEHVSVERRPVDQAIGRSETGDVFRDREIEMTERSEEAVVDKDARIREEVVVRKTSDERVEQIDDTVRRTEVEIDEGGSGNRSAFKGLDGDRDNDGVRDDLERSSANRNRDGLI